GGFRRFQVKTEKDGVLVMDDYAHHATEVQATLEAARKGWEDRRILAVFQPHLYSRTQEHYEVVGLSFLDAEGCLITDIYPDRETPIEGVTGKLVADTAKEYGHQSIHYVKDKHNLSNRLKEIAEAGDVIITMGAGDIYKYGEEFVDELENGITTLN